MSNAATSKTTPSLTSSTTVEAVCTTTARAATSVATSAAPTTTVRITTSTADSTTAKTTTRTANTATAKTTTCPTTVTDLHLHRLNLQLRQKLVAKQAKIRALTKVKYKLSRTIQRNKTKKTSTQCATASLKEPLKSLMQFQVNNTQNKPKGRRWNNNDVKHFALGLHYHSAEAYRYTKSVMTLPAESTLDKWLSGLDIGEGWTEHLFQLMKQKSMELSNEARLCQLSVDEMALKSTSTTIASKTKPSVSYPCQENALPKCVHTRLFL